MLTSMAVETTTERRVRGRGAHASPRSEDREEESTAPVTMPYLGRVLGKVLGTMSKVVLGVSRARVRPRAASGSPPGSEQTSRASHSMQATGLPGNLVPAWVLVGGDVHVGVQGGRARVRRGAWREQWRPRPRPGGRHCRQHDRRDPDRGEGAIVSTRRHHFTSLHFTSLHFTSRHFTRLHLTRDASTVLDEAPLSRVRLRWCLL